MAVNRGDECVRFPNKDISSNDAIVVNNSAIASNEEINSSIIDINASGDNAPLIERNESQSGQNNLIGNGHALFEDSEIYKGFKKIRTIPAAALSIVAGFVMIASVCRYLIRKYNP